jgi:hypothetical protein
MRWTSRDHRQIAEGFSFRWDVLIAPKTYAAER